MLVFVFEFVRGGVRFGKFAIPNRKFKASSGKKDKKKIMSVAEKVAYSLGVFRVTHTTTQILTQRSNQNVAGLTFVMFR